MKFPLTYYVQYTYKSKDKAHHFRSNQPLTLEMIEQEIEHLVSSEYGPGYDPAKIKLKSYWYEESN
jgi:hypothetical protein